MSDKPLLKGLWRNNEATPEGKYLVQRRDGTVVEWPSFVLGARDPAAAIAIRAYATEAKRLGYNDGFVNDLFALVDEFEQYRAMHGDGDPDRGKHRVDDPLIIEKMKKGKSA